MYLNFLNLEYKDYKVDFNQLKLYLEYLYKIQEFSIKNQIPFLLIGHISLILLSRKIYRNPNDIDILISLKDLNKWIDFLKDEWECFGNVDHIEIIGMFVRDELQKFASVNINKCSMKENSADLYKINKTNFSVFKISESDNQFNEKIIEQPKFIYHNPNEQRHDNKNFIEIKDEKFKIWFYTNSLAQHFKAYIIFYDQNLIRTELIECSFQFDYTEDNNTYAYWSSPEIDLNKVNGCYYRIFVHKEMFGFRFQNINTKILLECYIYKDLSDFYKEPILNKDISAIKGIDMLLNNLPIRVTYPFRSLHYKYGREKDFDDFEVYKYLLDEYPLTNSSK